MTPRQERNRIMGALLATVGALGLAACDRGADEAFVAESTPTIEHIEQGPDQFLGRQVTLTGEIDEVYSQRAFELEDLSPVFDDEVLVLTKSPVHLGAQKLQDDKTVSVVGTVRKLVVAEIERELGWDLDREVEIEWVDKPVVVADSIEAIRSYARWSEKDQPEGEIVSLWALYTVPAPVELDKAKITLESVEVAKKTQSGLWVGFNGNPELFVVAGSEVEVPEVETGSSIDVKGTVKRVPSSEQAAEQWALDDADKRRLTEDDVYLEASSVKAAEQRAQKPQAEPSAARQEG